MDLKNKIIVITGAANGIGRAMAIRFTAQGAKKIICADLDEDGVYETAEQVGGIAHKIDVSREADISTLIEITETEVGPIDLYCSNAGISIAGGVEVDNEGWNKIWNINLMAHVWAARHLVPRMTKRGSGYLLNRKSYNLKRVVLNYSNNIFFSRPLSPVVRLVIITQLGCQ